MAANLARRIDSLIRAALLLLIAAAAVGSVLVVTKSRPEPVLLSPSALSSQAISLSQSESVPGGALVQAPLFWESRQPYVAPEDGVIEEAPVTGSSVIDNMQLVGIVASGVQSSAAIVTIRGQRQRIPFGGEVDGWELIGMEPTEVTFLGIDRNGDVVERTLSLEDGRSQTRTKAGSEGASASQRSPWFNLGSDTDSDTTGADDVEDLSDTQNNPDQNG